MTTFTIFRFPANKAWWAFGQMGRRTLENPEGTLFSKMLGTGRNGFSIVPDFQQYTFLATWESEQQADHFFKSSVFQNYASRASEYSTLKMTPIQTHGRWDGMEPFLVADTIGKEYNGPVVVLTRAKINFMKLFDFWRHVPQANAALKKSPGVLLALGIGEVPLVEQATVSVWESVESLKKFAYRQSGHKEIVQRTRERGWYSEELFARFVPVGEWRSENEVLFDLSTTKFRK